MLAPLAIQKELRAKLSKLPSTFYSAEQMALSLHNNVDTFIARLPLPNDKRAQQIARNLVLRDGPEIAFYKLAISVLDQIGVENAPTLEFKNGAPINREVWRSNFSTRVGEGAESTFRAHISDEVPLPPLEIGGHRLAPFKGEIFVTPESTRNIFKYNLQLAIPAEEMREVKRNLRTASVEEDSLVLASAEVVPTGGGIGIAHFESPIYSSISDSKLREKYVDWAHFLLLGARLFVADLFIRSPSHYSESIPYVVLPNAENLARYLRNKRHPEDPNTIRINLPQEIRHCYSVVPKRAGFKLINHQEVPLESIRKSLKLGIFSQVWLLEALPAKELKFEQLIYKAAQHEGDIENWLREQSKSHLGERSVLAQIRPYFDRTAEISALRWLKSHEELFPAALFDRDFSHGVQILRKPTPRIRMEGINRTTELLQRGFTSVPSEAIKSERIIGMTREMEQAQKSALGDPDLRLVQNTVKPSCTFFSQGKERVSGAWWDIHTRRAPGWHLVPLHIEGQNRHPVLRFVLHNSQGAAIRSLSVGSKGSGLREFDRSLVLPPLHPYGTFRLPIYIHREAKKGEVVPSTHIFWGGAARSELEGEFLSTLTLLEGLKRINSTVRAPIAVPLDLTTFLEIPLWENGREERVSEAIYRKKVIGNDAVQTPLACMRSVSRSDVRFAEFINRVLLSSGNHENDLQKCQDQIDSALKFLYWTHQQKLRLPQQGLTPTRGAIGPSEILKYLRLVGAENYSAAAKIQRDLATPLVATLGMVHGAEGHLGGTYVDQCGAHFGAFKGGCMTLRNLDVAGYMHDIDSVPYLPWGLHYNINENLVAKFRLKYLQQGDLFYLRDTMYWLDKILFGGSYPTGTELIEYKVLGSLNPIHRVGALESDLAALKPTGWQRKYDEEKRPVPEKLITDPAMREVYSDYFERGRSLRVS